MILPGRPDQCQPKIIIYCLGLQTSMEKNVQVERGRWPKPKNVDTLRRDRELQLIFPRQKKLLIKNEEVCSRDVVACFSQVIGSDVDVIAFVRRVKSGSCLARKAAQEARSV